MDDKKLLMLVDDDKDDRFFFLLAVRELGESFECLFAKNGLEALEILKTAERLPDYIFLDLNMPYMNGKECLTELKNNSGLKDIPVIMYSTSTYEDDVNSTAKMGAAYYLSKPLDFSTLPDKILHAIEEVKQKVISFLF